MTSSFEKIIDIGTNYLHLARTSNIGGTAIDYLGRWDGTANTFASVGGGVSAFSLGTVSVPGTDNVYVCGSFTLAGGSVSVNKIAYWNGSSWSNLAGATLFTGTVQAMAYDSVHGLLYASSYDTTITANRIGVWNGASWTGIAEATVSNYCKLTIDGDGNLYAGYGSVLKRYTYQTSTWETLSSSIGGTISDVKYNEGDNKVYVTLYISGGSSVQYYDIAGNTIVALANLAGYPRAVAFDSNNNIFVACQSPSVYQGSVVKYTGSGWDNVYNYQNTSGVLDLEIDANDNIFGYANAGSLVIGVYPYTAGNWEGISSSATVNYGGPRVATQPQPSVMDYVLGDQICLKTNNTQHGTIIRLNPLGIQKGFVVKWSDGPMYSAGKMMAYFGDSVDNNIEHVV